MIREADGARRGMGAEWAARRFQASAKSGTDGVGERDECASKRWAVGHGVLSSANSSGTRRGRCRVLREQRCVPPLSSAHCIAVRALRKARGRRVWLMTGGQFPGIAAGSARALADALRDLLEDPEVGMFSFGGPNSDERLEYMAPWAAEAFRKQLLGYSDSIVVFLGYQAITHSMAFYGAAALPQFGEWPQLHREYVDSLVWMVLDGRPGEWRLPEWYTQQDTDWAEGDEFLRPPYGPTAPLVMREGTGGGVLFGGNLPTMNLLVRTERWRCPRGADRARRRSDGAERPAGGHAQMAAPYRTPRASRPGHYGADPPGAHHPLAAVPDGRPRRPGARPTASGCSRGGRARPSVTPTRCSRCRWEAGARSA
jgi:hypothetical protein